MHAVQSSCYFPVKLLGNIVGPSWVHGQRKVDNQRGGRLAWSCPCVTLSYIWLLLRNSFKFLCWGNMKYKYVYIYMYIEIIRTARTSTLLQTQWLKCQAAVAEVCLVVPALRKAERSADLRIAGPDGWCKLRSGTYEDVVGQNF